MFPAVNVESNENLLFYLHYGGRSGGKCPSRDKDGKEVKMNREKDKDRHKHAY